MECVAPRAPSYHWSIELRSFRGRARKLDPQTMTASELMFFFGAPLAHVVHYEDHLRRAAARQAARGSARLTKLIAESVPIAAPAA